MHNRTCNHCGDPFIAKTERKKYCSERCNDKAKPSASGLSCRVCGGWMQRGATSQPQGKAAHRACRQLSLVPVSERPTHCAHCKDVFESKRRSALGGAWTKCCSKSCARNLELADSAHNFQVYARYGEWTRGGDSAKAAQRGELARRKRRARLAGVKREPYTLATIAERDGYICHIGKHPVDMSAKWPDLGSPSVDHILPLSQGGDDTLTNVALACLGCNLSKGNRMEVPDGC